MMAETRIVCKLFVFRISTRYFKLAESLLRIIGCSEQHIPYQHSSNIWLSYGYYQSINDENPYPCYKFENNQVSICFKRYMVAILLILITILKLCILRINTQKKVLLLVHRRNKQLQGNLTWQNVYDTSHIKQIATARYFD